MPFVQIISMLAPFGGIAGLLVAESVARLRPFRRLVAPITTGMVFLGVFFAPADPQRLAVLSAWRPAAFFGTMPLLQAAPTVWPLALAFACAVASGALVQLSRPAEPSFALGVSTLALLAAGLAALWGENLLTVLCAWAGFDLAWVLGATALGIAARWVVLGAGLSGLSTVVLWAGALVTEGQGAGLSWRLMDPDGLAAGLLLLAGLLRLGLYPFHLTRPVEEGRALPGATPLLLGPVLGFGLLVRLSAAWGGTLAGGPWVEGLAVAAFVGGGLLALSRVGPGAGRPWVGTASVGGLVWAALQAGDDALPVLAAGGLVWILGVALLNLGRGIERTAPWWSAGSFLGGLALLGVPLTPGLIPLAFLTGSFLSPLAIWRVLLYLVGQALLTAAVARRILRSAWEEEPLGLLSDAARAFGLVLPVLLLLVGGLFPALLLRSVGSLSLLDALGEWGVLGALLWAVGVAGGVGLFLMERRFRQSMETLRDLFHDFFRLEWALRLVLGSLARAGAFVGAVADVVEGAGAILWALAIFLLAVLVGLRR